MTKEEFNEIKNLITELAGITEFQSTSERCDNVLDILERNKQLLIHGVGSSLPDLAECNQASLDYATKKDSPDFFLIKQTFKEGINWALNYVTKNK